jgi:hypothetical protein
MKKYYIQARGVSPAKTGLPDNTPGRNPPQADTKKGEKAS